MFVSQKALNGRHLATIFFQKESRVIGGTWSRRRHGDHIRRVADPVTGRGVPGWGLDSDQPTDSLCAPPRAGENCDPGGG